MTRLDTPLSTLSDSVYALEENMFLYMADIPRHTPGMMVSEGKVRIIQAGVPSESYNFICRSRMAVSCLEQTISKALKPFRSSQLPVSWWISPSCHPDDLGSSLKAAGMTEMGSYTGMICSLEQLPTPVEPSGKIQLCRVQHPTALQSYARLIRDHTTPADKGAVPYFSKGAKAALRRHTPFRFYIAVQEGQAISGLTVYLGAGVAGLYQVATLPRWRRQGIASWLTLSALHDVFRAGWKTAVLQSTDHGEHLYRRIGFIPCCEIVGYRYRP